MESDIRKSASAQPATLPRNCLIVLAHPIADSLNAALARHIRRQLEAHGWSVTFRDLYGTGFAPALTAQERASHYAEPFDASGVEVEIAELLAADILILVYPTWWFGFPAILKGWFDRVWAPGYAYENAPDLGTLRPRLTRLCHVIAVTTLGSPWWVDWLVLNRPLARVLKRAIIGLCAPGAKFRVLSLYRAEAVSAKRFDSFLHRIDKAIARIP